MSGQDLMVSLHCARGRHYDCSGQLGCECDCHEEPAAPGAAGLAGTPDVERLAERVVANWRVNFDPDDDRPLINMIAANLDAIKREAQAEALEAAANRIGGAATKRDLRAIAAALRAQR